MFNKPQKMNKEINVENIGVSPACTKPHVVGSTGIKERYSVRSIDSFQVREWCLYKHYAKKVPSVIKYSFGCFDLNKIMIGVCVFGLAGNSNLNEIENYPVLELTRLILNDEKEKNVTSYFVSQCLKMLPHKGFVISFADANQNHHGFIYQATNFIYTGLSAAAEVYTNGTIEMHSKTFSDKYGRRDKAFAKEQGFEINTKEPKHRYFFILGNKAEKEKMKKILIDKFGIKEYPKGENKRYDAGYKPTVQMPLF